MKRTGRQIGMIVALALTVLATARANNIRVENVATLYQGVKADDTVYVEFDLSWENSWRNDLNHDAAWVFIKFRAPGSSQWQHAYLSTDTAHHTASGADITVGTSLKVSDALGMGVFVYSANNHTGSVSYARTRLLWDYGQSGYSFVMGDVIDVSVHAIEMVYVAEGSFSVGSGGSESGCFTDGSYAGSGQTMPFAITSEAALEIGENPGELWGTSQSGNNSIGGGGTLPAAFPKGKAAFYCMKYAITQGQYVEFLNLLTYEQQDSRIADSPSADPNTYPYAGVNQARNAIHIAVSGVYPGTSAVYATGNPYVACNHLSWMDGAAYAQWAGLRPMTELEYEKACRGLVAPVANEYAWGTASIRGSTRYILDNPGKAEETVTNPEVSDTHGNAVYASSRPLTPFDGPLRVGIFALDMTSCRVRSGATYWGIMEMSGNLWERPVSVGRATDGRTFKGTHGDGVLSPDGHATLEDWPGWGDGTVTSAGGAGLRGAGWLNASSVARASDRISAALVNSARDRNNGWRGVRTASSGVGP